MKDPGKKERSPEGAWMGRDGTARWPVTGPREESQRQRWLRTLAPSSDCLLCHVSCKDTFIGFGVRGVIQGDLISGSFNYICKGLFLNKVTLQIMMD